MHLCTGALQQVLNAEILLFLKKLRVLHVAHEGRTQQRFEIDTQSAGLPAGCHFQQYVSLVISEMQRF